LHNRSENVVDAILGRLRLGDQIFGQLEKLANFVQLRQIGWVARKNTDEEVLEILQAHYKVRLRLRLAPAAVVGTRHTATRARATIEKSATVTEKEY